MFSVKKSHFSSVQKRESYKVLFQKAIKLIVVKTHWTANSVFQYGSVSYMVCVMNTKMFALIGPNAVRKIAIFLYSFRTLASKI